MYFYCGAEKVSVSEMSFLDEYKTDKLRPFTLTGLLALEK